MVFLAPVTRSGESSGYAASRYPHEWPAIRAGDSGGRTGGRRDPSAGRTSVRQSLHGGRSAPAVAVSPPVARLLLWRAGADPRAIPEPIRAEAQPALDSHGAAFSLERTAPTPEIVHRASPSRNGGPAHRHRRRGWHACHCSLSPEGRALYRKPILPPYPARSIHGRGQHPGGAPEFRIE